MLKKFQQILNDSPFLRHNAIFFGGSMAISALNYLYYPVIGRMLSTEAFGEVQVGVSLLMQMMTLLNVLALLTITILVSEKDKQRAARTIAELEKVSLYLALVLFGIVVVTSGILQQALKFESVWPLIIIALVFVVSIPLSFRAAYLRSRNDFTGTSLSGIYGSLAKLILSVALVAIGLKAFGAVTGILFAQAIAFIYTLIRAKHIGYHRPSSARRPSWSILRPQLPFALFVLGVSLLITMQVSIDATVIKYYFTPEQAGAYAGIATVARIVFFLAASTTAVMLSSVSYSQSDAKNREMLKKSLFLTALAAGSATLIFCLFPRLVVHLLLGGRYDAYVHLLPILSVTILLASFANLMGTYLIALRRYAAIIPVVVGAVVTYVLIVNFHTKIDQIINGILIGTTVMSVGLTGVICKRRQTRS